VVRLSASSAPSTAVGTSTDDACVILGTLFERLFLRSKPNYSTCSVAIRLAAVRQAYYTSLVCCVVCQPHIVTPKVRLLVIYFRRRKKDMTLPRVDAALRRQAMQRTRRTLEPTAAFTVSQFANATGIAGLRGQDAESVPVDLAIKLQSMEPPSIRAVRATEEGW
jgi:hypothetical protein